MSLSTITQVQIIFLLLLGLIGCGDGARKVDDRQVAQSNQPTIAIAEVQKNGKPNSTVYLKGRIGHQAPLLKGTVYELLDATSSIWIVTQQPVPSQTEEIVIQGIVRYQSIQLNETEQGGFYIEQQR
jgi:hypothetical protein